MLDFFKQVLPVGIAEVIFLPHLAKTTKKQKGAVKKSSQEKRLRSCQKARQQSFFVV